MFASRSLSLKTAPAKLQLRLETKGAPPGPARAEEHVSHHLEGLRHSGVFTAPRLGARLQDSWSKQNLGFPLARLEGSSVTAQSSLLDLTEIWTQ